MKFLVLLTQYKRPHLENQLIAINNQTLKPDYLVVFQNENHVDISHLKEKYDFIHIKSDFNTKFFGRFAACFTFPVDYCAVFDDDLIPADNCLKNYMDQCIKLNGIIGGNGRVALNNKNDPGKLRRKLVEVNVRQRALVDFVGHLWCFKKEWLHYMFSIEPFTYETGEDMHLCFTSKILGNIKSYQGEQLNENDVCDKTKNRLHKDEFATFLKTSNVLRRNVEKYFIEKFDIKFIDSN